MKKVYFIRHGATAGNLEHRYIGRTDEPLCDKGIDQADACVREGVPQGDVLFVSPLLRCRQTAEILFPNMEQRIVEDLRETDFGAFEGKTANELSDDPRYSEWLDSFCSGPIPEGDSIAELKERCVQAFRECAKIGQCPVFVVHGGVIMSILEALALPQKGFYDYYVKNCKVICCDYDGEHLYVREDT